MTRVICIGDVMTDVIAKLSGPLAIGSDTPSQVTLLGGGSGANTACWLAAAGVASVFAGRVGNDDPGRVAIAELRAAGVEVAVSVDPHRPTGTCLVLVGETGERTMLPDAGANAGLQAVDLPVQYFVAGAHLHVSGYAVLADSTRPAALMAMSLARERGLSLSVDAASAAPLQAAGPTTFMRWIGDSLLLFANDAEAYELTGQSDPLAAARMLSFRCGQAVVKRGADGAVWAGQGQAVSVPTTRMPVVDTTGAGDAFAAGFLAAQLGGIAGPLAVRLAHTYAARAVTRLGGRP